VCEFDQIVTDPDQFVLGVRGELDLDSAPGFSDRLERALAHGYPRVIVDLSAASFLDSSGLNVLFNVRRRLTRRGSRLGLVASDPSLLRTLQLTGLDRLAAVSPNLRLALGDGVSEAPVDP
jgi:anti-sigma B factor antagonist